MQLLGGAEKVSADQFVEVRELDAATAGMD